MNDTATTLLKLRDLLVEAVRWADMHDDTLMAIRLEEALACVQERIDR